MPEPHLTTHSKREIKNGLETYVFEVATSGIAAAVDKMSRTGDDQSLKRSLCGWYLTEPRPNHQDILSIDMSGKGTMTVVTMVIKRGHLILSNFINEGHIGIFYNRDLGKLFCRCHKERVINLPKHSFPSYNGFEVEYE